MPDPGQLTFISPRRATPPRHLADLAPADRAAAMLELGQPAAARERLVEALMPTLVTPVREISCDDGATRKTVWRLFDGTLVESVLMRYFGAATTGRAELGEEADAAEPGQA